MPDGTKLDLPTVNINDIELNNPYSLFDSKYSDHELNNLSWLKSSGQWNAKAVYPTAYDKLLKVYNGTETIEGLSVKPSTETYTDYDFVINTSDETFRLPLLNGDNIVFAPKEGSGSLLETFTTSADNTWETSTFTAPVTGWYWAYGAYSVNSSALRSLYLGKGFYDLEWQSARSVGPSGRDLETNHIWLNKGETFVVRSIEVKTRKTYYIEADIPNLYYYVGETVQNANLIDAGRIGEQLSDKLDRSVVKAYITETYKNDTSWYRVWSDGWCEQGGQTAVGTNITVALLKTYRDTSYNVQLTCVNKTQNDQNWTCSSKTTTSFVYLNSESYAVDWRACGCLAEGEYNTL